MSAILSPAPDVAPTGASEQEPNRIDKDPIAVPSDREASRFEIPTPAEALPQGINGLETDESAVCSAGFDLASLLPGVNSLTTERPEICVEPNRIARILDEAEAALARTGGYFLSGNQIVAIIADPATDRQQSVKLTPGLLMQALDGAAKWRSYHGRSNTWKAIDPPPRYCNLLSERLEWAHLTVLHGLARQPFLRPDGSICRSAGYDKATGIYGAFHECDFQLKESPSHSDAEQALAELNDLISECAFAGEEDRAAALAALITAAIRPSLDLAPMFHVRAPQSGTGKSFLCEIIGTLASADRGSPASFPSSKDDCERLLLAQLSASPAVIEFDNLVGDIQAYPKLCAALTSEQLTGRILGTSNTTSVSTRTLMLSSGNNVGPVADMTRRTVVINLDARTELPTSRTFRRPNLVAEIRADRGRYVSAALTVVRAWMNAGQPRTACAALVSFGQWSDWVRQPLLWMGCHDPAHSTLVNINEDPEKELLGRLMDAWHKVRGTAPTKARDLIECSARGRDALQKDLAELLEEIAGDAGGHVNHRRLGRWIKRNAGRMVGGLKIAPGGAGGNVKAWAVQKIADETAPAAS